MFDWLSSMFSSGSDASGSGDPVADAIVAMTPQSFYGPTTYDVGALGLDPSTGVAPGGDWVSWSQGMLTRLADAAMQYRLGGTSPVGPGYNSPVFRDPVTGQLYPAGRPTLPATAPAANSAGIVLTNDALLRYSLIGAAAWLLLRRL